MKYLIISNDDELTEQLVTNLNDCGIKTACHIENNVHTFTLDELSEIDALVVDVPDIKVITESIPLESIHIVPLTKKNSSAPNAFMKALMTCELVMPINANCSAYHDYNQNRNKSTVQEYAQTLSTYKSEHDSVSNAVKYCVKNNRLRKGAYEDTVAVEYDFDGEVCSSESYDVFTDTVMSDSEVYRHVISAYIENHPITE